jgi:hypothetical protein
MHAALRIASAQLCMHACACSLLTHGTLQDQFNMASSTDFLDTLYAEFGTDGIVDSSSFRLIVDLAQEGDYEVAAEVLEALVDDGNTDLACELYRAVCLSTTATSAMDAPDSLVACRVIEELLYNGSIAQAVAIVGEVLCSSANADDPEAVLIVEKMVDLGHLDWVVLLCSGLLDTSSPSFAILMSQMVDCGLLPLATQICVELIRDPSKAFYHTQKLRAIRAELMEAGYDACAVALCSQVLEAMDTPYSLLEAAPVAPEAPVALSVLQPSVMEAY